MDDFISVLYSIIFSPSTWIIILPVALHLIDKSLERMPIFDRHFLKGYMREGPQRPVQTLGYDDVSFDAVEAYFSFRENCHRVICWCIFSVLGLYVAQVECVRSLFYLIPGVTGAFALGGAVVILIGLDTFWIRLQYRCFHPAAALPTDTWRWEWFSVGSFVFAIGMEIWLRSHPALCKIEC